MSFAGLYRNKLEFTCKQQLLFKLGGTRLGGATFGLFWPKLRPIGTGRAPSRASGSRPSTERTGPMADKNDGGDKTEKPTQKRLQDARKKGDVPKSK